MSFTLSVIIVSLHLLACSDEKPSAPTLPGPATVEEAPTSNDVVAGEEPEEQPTEPLETRPAPLPDSDSYDTETNELQLALERWQAWAPRCESWPSKENCDDGDATLFSGLLCASGSTEACEAVAASQGLDGRFWRSPRRVDKGGQNSFSRDMALGVLLYLLSSKDQRAATRWLNWIDQHSVCQLGSETNCALRAHKLCLDDTDGRCIMTPAIWAMAARVWQALGLPQHSEMSRWRSYAEERYLTETETVALGYALHLKAVTALLYQRLELKLSFEAEWLALLQSRQPQNVFLRYLAGEAPATLQTDLLSLCPVDPPTRKFQWTWERDTAEQAWVDSMGWDCIFLGRLILARD